MDTVRNVIGSVAPMPKSRRGRGGPYLQNPKSQAQTYSEKVGYRIRPPWIKARSSSLPTAVSHTSPRPGSAPGSSIPTSMWCAVISRPTLRSKTNKVGATRTYPPAALPSRKTYFPDIGRLPTQYVLFGSDFPTPVFELSANLAEVLDDFKAVLQGQLDRILVPQDNLLDVNRRELLAAFPGHPMFTNFGALCESLGITG